MRAFPSQVQLHRTLCTHSRVRTMLTADDAHRVPFLRDITSFFREELLVDLFSRMQPEAFTKWLPISTGVCPRVSSSSTRVLIVRSLQYNDNLLARLQCCDCHASYLTQLFLSGHGVQANRLMVITHGVVSVELHGHLVCTLRPGDFFGHLSLLVTHPWVCAMLMPCNAKCFRRNGGNLIA